MKLPVAAFHSNSKPPVSLDQGDELFDFHSHKLQRPDNGPLDFETISYHTA